MSHIKEVPSDQSKILAEVGAKPSDSEKQSH
jgi:hypothetical protein